MPTIGLVKWYSNFDNGAPVLSGTAGSLVALLDAVLRDGYGSKSISGGTAASGLATYNVGTLHNFKQGQVLLFAGANEAVYNGEKKVLSAGFNTVTCAIDPAAPAASTGAMTAKTAPLGWSKVFADTNLGCYASVNPDSPKHVLRVDDTGAVVSARSAGVRGYESMVDVNIGGAPFPTSNQVANSAMLWMKSNTLDATARYWYIVGDDRCLYFFSALSASFPNQFQGSFYGDLAGTDPYSTTLHAFSTENFSTTSALPECVAYASNATAIAGYHPRSAGAYGSAVQVYKVGVSQSTYSGLTGSFAVALSFPNGLDNTLILSPFLSASGPGGNRSVRGTYPGIQFCIQNIAQTIPHGTVLDGSGPFLGRKLLAITTYPAGNSNPTATGTIFFDVTGPWRA